MPNTQPTIKQMVHRARSAGDGHRTALRHIAEGTPVLREGAFVSEIRGMQTVIGTLRRWGCVTTERVGAGQYNTEITERGRELLAALNEAWQNEAWRQQS
jgi:hypothetical protein